MKALTQRNFYSKLCATVKFHKAKPRSLRNFRKLVDQKVKFNLNFQSLNECSPIAGLRLQLHLGWICPRSTKCLPFSVSHREAHLETCAFLRQRGTSATEQTEIHQLRDLIDPAGLSFYMEHLHLLSKSFSRKQRACHTVLAILY